MYLYFVLLFDDSIWGLLPLCFHVDGAEFYTNSEVLVWPVQSIFAGGHVWDCKYPLVVIPHELLRDQKVKDNAQKTIANIMAWSLKFATLGVWPSSGPNDDIVLSGDRKAKQGRPLAGGIYKACYFGYKADGKGRKDSNLFPRTYLHGLICESCLAQRDHKGWQPLLTYKDFYQSAGHRLTKISSELSWTEALQKHFSK